MGGHHDDELCWGHVVQSSGTCGDYSGRGDGDDMVWSGEDMISCEMLQPVESPVDGIHFGVDGFSGSYAHQTSHLPRATVEW